MSMRSLPPLDLLVPFEASARLGSFTRAADELSVTQSAVSQRVRKLEDLLGTPLFTRQHRAITLTSEGRELLNGVTAALRHLSAATQGVLQRENRPLLRMQVDTSIAHLWLMPKLSEFAETGPPVTLDLTVSDALAKDLSADVAILHGDGTWPGYSAQRLFDDEVFPVCAPSYLLRHPIETIDDLLSADLIDLDYLHWNWINWGIWLTEVGLDPAKARIIARTNAYMAQLDGARAGLGVALGWHQLLDNDLETGRLVRPISNTISTGYGYYLLIRDGANEAAQSLARHLGA